MGGAYEIELRLACAGEENAKGAYYGVDAGLREGLAGGVDVVVVDCQSFYSGGGTVVLRGNRKHY